MGSIEYVFFSGGYDSTYYLLYCLLIKKVKVQPIVVKVPFIDGVTSSGRPFKRNSTFHEEVSRQNFYKKFKDKYPKIASNLLDEIVFNNVTVLDKDTVELGKYGYKNNLLLGRPVTVHLYLHQVCKDIKIDKIAALATKEDNLTEEEKNFVNTKLKFSTPLMEVSKYEMLKNAEKFGFDNFLYETWSCYHPLPFFKPCGKCRLCRDRIIDTYLKGPSASKII